MSKTLQNGKRQICSAVVVAAALTSLFAHAQDDLFEMSLGDLLDIQVTSVAKKSQTILDAPAAVFVITAEDIRRSGVTTIPEALRMAPGVDVAKVDANKWAISVRGFQGRFSNKLLVLMDGRVLYSTLFSGVFWDAQDTFLEDVERIEVVRGPGAALWGANAVNGVINIITRGADETEGKMLVAGVGDQERGYAGVRIGGAIGNSGHYRAYAKHFNRDGNIDAITGADTADDWDQSRLGFRTDFAWSDTKFTFQGDAYRGNSGAQDSLLSFAPPYQFSRASSQDISGFNLLARYEKNMRESDQLSVQTFVDQEERDWNLVDFERITFDVDVDYRLGGIDRHDLLLGLNYRNTRDRTRGSLRTTLDPDVRDEELISVFAQDEWMVIPDKLTLTAGIKLEKNDYTGIEYQPNLRFLWQPTDRKSYWASVSRAVRTPGRAERDSRALIAVIPPQNPGGFVTAVTAVGNRDFEAETLLAYEAGFKFDVSDTFVWDLALYYNDYDDLRATAPSDIGCFPGGTIPLCFADPNTIGLGIETQQNNEGAATNWGVEWSGSWQVASNWQLKGSASRIDESSSAAPGNEIIDLGQQDPRHSLSVRSFYQISRDLDFDIWLRYVDKIRLRQSTIEAYTNLDARLAWRPADAVELSLSARNLFGSPRVEFESELSELRSIEIQRSVHLQLTLNF